VKRWIPLFVIFLILCGGVAHASNCSAVNFPPPIGDYRAMEVGKNLPLSAILAQRIRISPFNLIATILFLCAIVHTFLAPKFARLAEKLSLEETKNPPVGHFLATICHFLGEVEVIFGIWAIPLVACMAVNFGWHAVGNYFNNALSFAEPVFVVVIMAIAATRPILSFSEEILRKIANFGRGTVAAWWISILITAPFMGSLITEPAAMTIGAMLLAKQFYNLNPSKKLRYATLGLLFVNVSIGGTLTNFAAPPILMVAHRWNLTLWKVFSMLGARAVVGVVAGTLLYYALFRREFGKLQSKREFEELQKRRSAAAELDESAMEVRNKSDANALDESAMEACGKSNANILNESAEKIPPIVVAIHCLFLAWTVFNLHTPPLVIAGFLFFLAFAKGTRQYQDHMVLKSPVLVGFFLAGLVTHGGLQEWWISPLLGSLKEFHLFIGATALTAFNDNAAITYLSSLVADFAANDSLQRAVLSGAVTGGGLTVIANAPNPAGQNILSKYFGGTVSPLYLFFGAAVPTAVVALCFNFL
jgi:Na+/H+ antiporter NhaD/arsenite permease-like protein